MYSPDNTKDATHTWKCKGKRFIEKNGGWPQINIRIETIERKRERNVSESRSQYTVLCAM